MLELLVVIGAVLLVGTISIGLLKLLLALFILPLKLGFWVLKGFLGIILFVPALLFSIWALSCVVPIVLAVIAVPVIFVAICVVSLTNALF